jgi:hypothetical protein
MDGQWQTGVATALSSLVAQTAQVDWASMAVGTANLSTLLALAMVPGLGLVVREHGNGGRLQLFATVDAVAMAAMSPLKTTWMTAVARVCRRNEM